MLYQLLTAERDTNMPIESKEYSCCNKLFLSTDKIKHHRNEALCTGHYSFNNWVCDNFYTASMSLDEISSNSGYSVDDVKHIIDNHDICKKKEDLGMANLQDVNAGVAVITGVQGQDGSYLAELLLSKGYKVVGTARRKSSGETNDNIKHIDNSNFEVVYLDITDSAAINWLVQKHKPEMYFNLAAQSHVGQSFVEPISTFKVNAEAVYLMLEAIRMHSPKTKVYQAGTSELWGSATCPESGFNEESVFHPRSPYSVAKSAAFYAMRNYREAYGLFCVNGILCNHSSPRRGHDFATRKITKAVANIVCGKQDKLHMGNLEAFRDEGHAADYVKAMFLMLQQDHPDDYVVSTGDGATIRQMLDYVCELGGLSADNIYVPDERFMRPSDVPFLKGDPSKIAALGWKPEHTWKSLLKDMFENDLKMTKGQQ